MNNVVYEGKSKLVCRGRGDDSFIIRYKDSATAFNGQKKMELAGKGRLNAAISNIIYGYLAEHGVDSAVPEYAEYIYQHLSDDFAYAGHINYQR